MQRWNSREEHRSLPREYEWQGRTYTRKQLWCLLAAMSSEEATRDEAARILATDKRSRHES